MRSTTTTARFRAILICGLAALSADRVVAGAVDLPYQIGGALSVRVTSLKEARFKATVRQQFDFSCGSAALSTLLTHHYGHPVSEQQVFDDMFRLSDQAKVQREGFSMLDMKRYLSAHGFDADGFDAPLASLDQAGVPAVVLINERGYNHFVVVKGVRDGRVLFGDPASGTRAMAESAFESLRVNGIVFVIGNRQESARFNLAGDWQALPRAPLGGRGDVGRLATSMLPKFGASDF